MPAGAFLGESVDAVRPRAVLGSTREVDAVPFGLHALRPLGIVVRRARVDIGLWPGVRCCVSVFDACCERTARATARLALGVKLGLRLGLALLLLQLALFAQRRAHDAATLLADPTSVVGDLLQ